MCFSGRKLIHFLDFHVAITVHTGTGRDDLANDDVLLETDEVIFLAIDCGLGEHAGSLLE